jgi:hypothetical protein
MKKRVQSSGSSIGLGDFFCALAVDHHRTSALSSPMLNRLHVSTCRDENKAD